jgi:endonuclease III
VPKAKGTQFVDLMSVLADLHCHEEEPACSGCPLRRVCPTGLDAKAGVAATSKKPR